jgi:hypothetical protein
MINRLNNKYIFLFGVYAQMGEKWGENFNIWSGDANTWAS